MTTTDRSPDVADGPYAGDVALIVECARDLDVRINRGFEAGAPAPAEDGGVPGRAVYFDRLTDRQRFLRHTRGADAADQWLVLNPSGWDRLAVRDAGRFGLWMPDTDLIGVGAALLAAVRDREEHPPGPLADGGGWLQEHAPPLVALAVFALLVLTLAVAL